MSEIIQSNAWLTDKADGRRFGIALAAGLALEVGVLALALPILTHQRPPSDKQSLVVKLSISAPAPVPPAPPPPKPVPKVPPPPRPVITPPPLPPPPPLPVAPQIPLPVIPMQPAHFADHPAHVRHVPPPPVTPPPIDQTPPTPAPPPPPPPSAPSAGEMDLFKAEMRRAVQNAAIDPPSAEVAHESGTVHIAFTYQDGAVSGIEVVGSSGYPILDEAAEAAARNAAYPAEPPDMTGKPFSIVVDVIFRPMAADIDGD